MAERVSVCFVALRAYPVLSGALDLQFIGGAEVQQVLLARELARKGHRVSLISFDFGQPRRCAIDDITVFSICRPRAGIPGLKMAHPFLTSLWRALKLADATVLYQRSASRLTGLVRAFAGHQSRAFIYAGAHDTDFMPGQELVPNVRDKMLYRYGLRRADEVIVQTPEQAKLLQQAYGMTGALIGSCHPRPVIENVDKDIDALWVGTFRNWKRPELFVELARACPQRRFVMVGGPASDEPALFKRAEEAAVGLPNLQVTGFVPYRQAETYFSRAKVFVNTSTREGFPNTFLQAWSRGVPTIAFFAVSMLGKEAEHLYQVSSFAAGLGALRKCLDDEPARLHAGRSGRTYFERYHTPEAVVSQYEALLSSGLKH